MSREQPTLCLVSRELTPPGAGGIGAVVRTLAERAHGEGFSCVLLLDVTRSEARRVRRQATDLHERGVDIHTVAELAVDPLPLHAFRSEAYWRSHRIASALERLAGLRRLDVIEFPDFEGLAYVPIKLRRLVGTHLTNSLVTVRIHGAGEFVARADGRFAYDPGLLHTWNMERYCLRYADAVLGPSSEVISEYRDRYELPSRVLVAAPPVSISAIPAHAACRVYEGGTLRVVFVGKLQPVKGPDRLVDAAVRCMARHGDESLEVHLIGGDAPGRVQPSHRAEIEARIPAGLSPRFHFHGRLPREIAFGIASECHLAVVPSRMETFCLTAHELRALGLPLAVADLPAFRAFFREGEGARFFDDASSLVDLLESALGDRRIGWAAPAVAPPQGMGASVYAELTAEPRPASSDVSMQAPSRDLVSILVPYYEMHRYVRDTIQSVEASSHRAWELILVDDGSPSREARHVFEAIQQERAGDPRFRFLRKENGGLGSARNAALALSLGRFVLPLDPDDLLHPQYLGRAVTALQRNPDLGFVSCIAALFRDGAGLGSAREWIVPYDPTLAMLLLENGVGTAASVFRRDVLGTDPYREDMPAYEDWDLQLRLARRGVSGEVIPQVLYFYRIRLGGLASSQAHVLHDVLLGSMLDRCFGSTAPPELLDALKIYAYVESGSRALGPRALRFEERRLRTRLVPFARSAYQRWLKAGIVGHLPERRREQLVSLAKRLLGAVQARP